MSRKIKPRAPEIGFPSIKTEGVKNEAVWLTKMDMRYLLDDISLGGTKRTLELTVEEKPARHIGVFRWMIVHLCGFCL